MYYLRGASTPRKLEEAQCLVDVIPSACAGVGISNPHRHHRRVQQGQVWRILFARKPVCLIEHHLDEGAGGRVNVRRERERERLK